MQKHNYYWDCMEKLLEKSEKNINEVQVQFDLYQKECFPERSAHFFCLELNGECGELANLEKKDWKGRKIEHERFEYEAADVFIALMNYCNSRGVNLGSAVAEKLRTIEKKRLELKAEGLEY